MMPAMRVEKAKSPRGMSYPPKSSVLSEVLSSAAIELETQLVYIAGHIFFDAYLLPANPNVKYERLYIRAGAVPSTRGYAARQHMEHTVIPEFVAWVKGILAVSFNSPTRQAEQYFSRDLPT